ncbi:MAG TPA: ferredoxin reductase [Solirubrobacterales bacterium]
MAETAAKPNVTARRQRALRAARTLFTPLLPDDYLELINPLWSTRELRGRIERISPEADGAVSLLIRPGFEWPGHRPGQYLRIGVVVDGVHHWRAYSLTTEPGRPDGCIGITPKLVPSGVVSPYLTQRARPGDVVRLGGVEGTFVLPSPPLRRALFVSAGSGITPIVSMLRSLDRADALTDVVHVHSARTAERVIFGEHLRELASRRKGLRLHLQLTGEQGRLAAADLDRLCPDWRTRETFASGPGEMLDALRARWQAEGDPARLSIERFQPIVGGNGATAAGGRVRFLASGIETECGGGTPILLAGEEAGAQLPSGCRMGICRTCVGRLRAGAVRDLRTGEVHDTPNETVRTCVNAPEGKVEIEL